MSTRAALLRVESAVIAAGGTFRQRGADTFRSIGVCHAGQRSESLVFFYDPDRGHVNVHCHAGCERDHILDTLRLSEADLFDVPLARGGACSAPRLPPPTPSAQAVPDPRIFTPAPRGWRPASDGWMPCQHEKSAEYLYSTTDSRVAFGVCRCVEKCFAQWRPDPSAISGRRWKLRELDARGNVVATVPALPYRLPQLLDGVRAERTVWIVEGEKDVLALVALGLVATCNAEGAGKWTSAHAAYLGGADVTIVADRDSPGRTHALKVVETLMPVARSIEVVQAAQGKDASDHLAAGGRPGTFARVAEPKPLRLEVLL